MKQYRWISAAAAICACLLVAVGIQAATSSPLAVTDTSVGRTGQCAVDAQGYCTVNHGLGGKPSAVVVTAAQIGQLASVDPATITATSFRVRFWWHTGGLFAAGQIIRYNVVLTLPEATTPPPSSSSPPPSSTPPTSVTPTPSPTATAGACANPVYTTSARENNGQGGFSNGGFVVHNNMWNDEAGPQTLSASTYKSWFVTSNQPGAGNDDSVKTYPGSQKLVSIPVSSTMPNLASSFNVTVPPGAGTIPTATSKGKQWNAAYDLWANNFGVEIMVWNTWTMNWRYWYGQYGGEQVTIDGVSYSVYHRASSPRAMWFVRNTPVNSGTVNLGSVARWALSKGWLTTSDRLNAIEYGFEIAYTGTPTRFDLVDYSLTTP